MRVVDREGERFHDFLLRNTTLTFTPFFRRPFHPAVTVRVLCPPSLSSLSEHELSLAPSPPSSPAVYGGHYHDNESPSPALLSQSVSLFLLTYVAIPLCGAAAAERERETTYHPH